MCISTRCAEVDLLIGFLVEWDLIGFLVEWDLIFNFLELSQFSECITKLEV